jgi:hypothetical protein
MGKKRDAPGNVLAWRRKDPALVFPASLFTSVANLDGDASTRRPGTPGVDGDE